jgi:hypothetical protein
MRTLSTQFLSDLKSGHLSPLLERVKSDLELDLNIRNDYINIYYKGHSVLRLDNNYSASIAQEFKNVMFLPQTLGSPNEVSQYLAVLPSIKENVNQYKSKTKSSYEIEYEQLIIRSNNDNHSANTDVFITDRQFADSASSSRFDLTGVFWPSKTRRSKYNLPLVFIEVKYSLNSDIKGLDQQISRYYAAVKQNIHGISIETESILATKIELGLYNKNLNLLKALKTKKVSDEIDDALFVIALVDYNPNSKLLSMAIPKLQQLAFSNQIRILHCGFGIWNDVTRLSLI